VRFVLLGPLGLIRDAGERTTIGGARLRVLLAALLLNANKPVSADTLADAVWDGAPPAGAATTLRGHVLRLRRILDPEAGDRIVARDPGYLIRVTGSELDVLEFQELCWGASAAIRDQVWSDVSARAAGALALWQGPPLADVASQGLRDAWVPRLEQTRVQALEWRIEADLQLGRRDQLVPELRALVDEHPLRERFRAQLMVALAGTGRQAEALAAYQDARRVLIGELGIEPGPELRELQERILAGDTELLSPVRQAVAVGPVVVPRQLPAATGHFVGRETELKVLSELLPRQAEAGGPVVISAISGTAGIGKTTLAVHWAHQVAPRFPDGQLYVNLRGFDPSHAPMASADAVRRFLDALDVSPERIPPDPEGQAALYRSRLAGRRMLILLDNARSAEQVRPLLPGVPGCLTVITSRDQLGGLVALDGAIPLTLDLLTEAEARDLLIRRLGSERVLSAGRTASELIGLCARLPLALNIAAARAALNPERPLSELVEELRDARRRLDALSMGDTAADVGAVFSWSYRTLSPETARVFRLLGLHTGPDISLEAVASLTALEPAQARRVLWELTRAHLLTEHAPGRFSFHDLLRAYAADKADAQESGSEPEDALRRACDFYLHTGYAADRLIAPNRPAIELDPPADGTWPCPLPDAPAAVAWFDAEHANVVAAQRTAASYGWHSVVWQLAWALSTFYRRGGRLDDQIAVWRSAVDSAAHLPDSTSGIRAHLHLGGALAEVGQHEEAIGNLNHALVLAQQHHNLADQAHTHFAFMRTWEQRGDHRQGLYHARCALALCRALGQPVWEADALNAVGWFAALLGDYETARAHCEDALVLCQHDGGANSRANCLDSLGYIEHRTGHHDLAIERYQEALSLFRGLGSPYSCAATLDNLGHPYAALGQHERARTVWRQALELYQRQGRAEDAERVQRQLDVVDA
jgi:DNA-binding SARP family transcriptional activator/tetratricopeptide (TPR) repeat protein